MEQLIPIINRLQSVFKVLAVDAQIDLPQIVVVGSQSAGKSSVLEAVVGKEFLPRGSGIVTRRPLVLQLYNIPKASDGSDNEYAEFGHIPKRQFTDFTKVRDEITHDTDRVSGSNKGISAEAIILRVFSSRVVNLTLVDLPGIAKNPVGDQPKDIEVRIKNLVLSYIKNPNAIILAVTAANTDIATSDGIQMARLVDPEGKRTVGVLTKVDLMDKGTDAVDILQNRQYPLQHGWVAVVNRSQKDINESKSVADSLRDEALFFESNQQYAPLASRQGLPYLVKQLNFILKNHIKSTIPELRAKINDMMLKTVHELEILGAGPGTKSQRSSILLRLINQFAADYAAVIEGNSAGAGKNELFGGARISYIYTEVLSSMLNRLELGSISEGELITVVRNAAGTSGSLFPSEHAFEVFVHRDLARLEGPCKHCLDLVRDELFRITRQLPNDEMKRYGALTAAIVECANALIRKLYAPAKTYLTDTLQCELAYINTNHPDFVGAKGAMDKAMTKAQAAAAAQEEDMFKNTAKKSSKRGLSSDAVTNEQGPVIDSVPEKLRAVGPISGAERLAIDMIPELLKSYHEIERKKIQDMIPKCVMYFLVRKSIQMMQQELTVQLYREDKLEELLNENPAIAKKRAGCLEMKKILDKALGILGDIREM
ncbi:Dynamin superfamily [Carpediemonas membranifera]|uniref:Dynamin superfamily n=1 Tax=Carpediemonas membranifera TaxID=201153 RepID=A0A8J6AS21_9EUKA|nr:Dynamin superfamily [Carpediemonas membranifera]|eukprot:KAG9392956.1 Dynamin superfamily [Carpediemonas membranifera]